MDVSLLDVVPSELRLRALLGAAVAALGRGPPPAARDALLGVFLPGRPSLWLMSDMRRDFPVKPHRADLRFEATDAAGETSVVLVETKVNDALSKSLVRAYCETGADVILDGPNLSGLLYIGNDQIDRPGALGHCPRGRRRATRP